MAKKITKKAAKKKAKKTTRKPRATSRKAAKAAPRRAASAAPAITEEQIRLRAFEIYRAGRNPRNPDADWFQAERELRAELSSR